MPSVLQASALTSLNNFKESMGLSTAADATNDNKYERFINRATDWIESATERKLKARRYNNGGSTHATTSVADEDYIYFSGRTKDYGGDTVLDYGHGLFCLPAYPIRPNSDTTFVVSILNSRESDTWDSSALVEFRDYMIDRDSGILRNLNGRFSSDFRNYRITCAAGYVTIPGDLEQLCLAVAKKQFRNESGLQSESLGTWSRSYSVEKENEFIDSTIARYRRFSV